MRPFRVWDSKERKLFYAFSDLEQLAIKDFPSLTYCDMEGFALLADGESLFLLDECGKWAFADTDRFKAMESTGLLDKNRVEIYEGDILESTFGRRAEVVWSEMDAAFRLRTIVDIGPPHPLSDRPTRLQEVIGNIYENPELLEKS